MSDPSPAQHTDRYPHSRLDCSPRPRIAQGFDEPSLPQDTASGSETRAGLVPEPSGARLESEPHSMASLRQAEGMRRNEMREQGALQRSDLLTMLDKPNKAIGPTVDESQGYPSEAMKEMADRFMARREWRDHLAARSAALEHPPQLQQAALTQDMAADTGIKIAELSESAARRRTLRSSSRLRAQNSGQYFGAEQGSELGSGQGQKQQGKSPQKGVSTGPAGALLLGLGSAWNPAPLANEVTSKLLQLPSPGTEQREAVVLQSCTAMQQRFSATVHTHSTVHIQCKTQYAYSVAQCTYSVRHSTHTA